MIKKSFSAEKKKRKKSHHTDLFFFNVYTRIWCYYMPLATILFSNVFARFFPKKFSFYFPYLLFLISLQSLFYQRKLKDFYTNWSDEKKNVFFFLLFSFYKCVYTAKQLFSYICVRKSIFYEWQINQFSNKSLQ